MLLYNFLGINNKLLVSKLLYLNTDSIDYYNCNKIYASDSTGNIIPSKFTTRLAISAPCWGSTKYLKIKIRVISGDLFRPIFSYRLLQDYSGGSRVGILTVSRNYNYARYTDFYNNGSLEIKAGYTSDDYIEVYFKVPSYGVAFVDIDHSNAYGSSYDWEENIKNGNMSISLVDSVGVFTGGEYTLSNGV